MSRPSKKKPSARQAGLTVDEYERRLSGWQKEVVGKLRALVKAAAPAAVESIKWGQPVYEANGPFCYLRAFSSSVNFGFWRGASLKDRRLKSGGALMGHIKLTGPGDLDERAFSALVKQAVALNQAEGDPTARR